MPLSLDGTTGISATGNIVGNNINANTLSVTTFAPTSVSASGNVTGGNILTAGLISATGNISVGNLNITGNIVDTGALGINTTSNGNITLNAGSGFIIASSGILNGQANGTGNIGSATGYFNTIHAKATSAQYADLAELYQADKQLDAAQVVEFGGTHEIQKSTTSHSTRVAGIVSTNPSYLMNSAMDVPHKVPVALTGRVPCYVVGKISKGDRLVASDISGVATVLDMGQYQPGCIIGKALEDYDSQDIGKIEVAVGRF
jgi:hypothetical protein